MAHQHIDRRAQRRIGGDAGIAVRAAALQRQHQFRGRHGLALHRVDGGQHRLASAATPASIVFLRAADLLDGHGAEGVAFGDVVGLLQARDLEGLAAQPHHQHAAHIGIGGIAPLGALAALRSLRP